MIQRVLLVAIAAGIAAGLFASLAQEVKVVPLILEAETFETDGAGDGQALAHSHGAEEPASSGHSHGDGEAWGPGDGFERVIFTIGSNIVAGVGFGLLLMAAIVLRGRDGASVQRLVGVAEALTAAGFAALVLAESPE